MSTSSIADIGSTTSLNAHSFALSSDVIAIVSSASSSNHIILWDSIPDTQHLPSPLNSAQFSLLNIYSTTCAPPCSSAGVCSPQGLCTCKSGFTGQACEACASGFFGPSCQKCPDNCAQCDEGISGTGRCLKSIGGGNKCNCLNGVCNSDGSCQCNAGFTKADNGTQCAKCTTGFFLTTTGDCKGTLYIVYHVDLYSFGISLRSWVYSMRRRYWCLSLLPVGFFSRYEQSEKLQSGTPNHVYWSNMSPTRIFKRHFLPTMCFSMSILFWWDVK